MLIDKYNKNFEYLANKELPKLLKILKEDIKANRSMNLFNQRGVGVISLCKQLNCGKDFSGCYLLINEYGPIYVGISRTVLGRLYQHVRGKTGFAASLAYRIAKDQSEFNGSRSDPTQNRTFHKKFEEAKEYLAGLRVAYVKIKNPVVLYVFEVYCSMYFKTGRLNTFETH